MKKIASLAMLVAFALGLFAAVAPASADPHKQRFQQQRCNGNTCR